LVTLPPNFERAGICSTYEMAVDSAWFCLSYVLKVVGYDSHEG